jgi:hypothetical protein
MLKPRRGRSVGIFRSRTQATEFFFRNVKAAFRAFDVFPVNFYGILPHKTINILTFKKKDKG